MDEVSDSKDAFIVVDEGVECGKERMFCYFRDFHLLFDHLNEVVLLDIFLLVEFSQQILMLMSQQYEDAVRTLIQFIEEVDLVDIDVDAFGYFLLGFVN